MTNKASEEALGVLHSRVADVLIENLETEEGPSPSIISIAVKFLKDNEITCSIKDNQDMDSLNEALKAKRAKRKLRIVGDEE